MNAERPIAGKDDVTVAKGNVVDGRTRFISDTERASPIVPAHTVFVENVGRRSVGEFGFDCEAVVMTSDKDIANCDIVAIDTVHPVAVETPTDTGNIFDGYIRTAMNRQMPVRRGGTSRERGSGGNCL